MLMKGAVAIIRNPNIISDAIRREDLISELASLTPFTSQGIAAFNRDSSQRIGWKKKKKKDRLDKY
jgi:hypothetical protein